MNHVESAIAEILPDVFADTSTQADSAPMALVIPEGQRDATLASLAGSMRRKGFSPEAIAAALFVVNEQQVRPMLPSRDIERIARSVGRYQPSAHLPAPPTGLEFLTVRELAARVAARGPRRWLLRGLWPGGDYGVHAAEMKAQKTWNTTDVAVSVASSTPFLGHVPVGDAGPVVMFVGEGGEANILRRGRAVAEARGLVFEDLAIEVRARAPHLNNAEHLALIAEKVHTLRPKLVTLDPLYLSARGANGADLYSMGKTLEAAQHICQPAGTALFIVTHFNRKQGSGAGRITGAGPAEWGRVLISASVKSRNTNPVTKATSVVTELDIIGGEIPDQTLRVFRRIWADEPDDLDSPLHVETTTSVTDNSQPAEDLSPAAQKLIEAMQALGTFSSSASLVDWIATKHGHGLTRQTVSTTLNELEERGIVASQGVCGRAKLWSLSEVGGVGMTSHDTHDGVCRCRHTYRVPDNPTPPRRHLSGRARVNGAVSTAERRAAIAQPRRALASMLRREAIAWSRSRSVSDSRTCGLGPRTNMGPSCGPKARQKPRASATPRSPTRKSGSRPATARSPWQGPWRSVWCSAGSRCRVLLGPQTTCTRRWRGFQRRFHQTNT